MKILLSIEKCGDEGGALTCHLLAPDVGVAATIAESVRGTNAVQQDIEALRFLHAAACDSTPDERFEFCG